MSARRFTIAALAVIGGLAACDAGLEGPALLAADPPYGPLVGGSRVTLEGSGFTDDGAAPNRVLIGGREAPLAVTVDDATLEVVIPPGEQPGDVEVVVLNDRGNARATGIFRYSAPPTITDVSPDDVLYTDEARITVRGTGFLDEGAGDVVVVLGGFLVADVVVLSDTELTFTAPPSFPLAQPDLELAGGRGRVLRPRAFRYLPSTRDGLLLFPYSGAFAYYFDPRNNDLVTIPWLGGPVTGFNSVIRDDHGDYFAADFGGWYGRIDMKTQRLEAPIPAPGWFPAMACHDDECFAIEAGALQFGSFDRITGSFVPLGEQLPCCSSYGLAADDDGAYYFTSRIGSFVYLNTVDPRTGAQGKAIPISAPTSFYIEELRFFEGTLYATTADSKLVTIDPTTGAMGVVPLNLGRFSAMELFRL
jgi:hypothetical protein